MRLVLDSNVWLDWLHFDDARIAPLKHAKLDGAIEIVIDSSCRDELARVLAYDRFGLTEAVQSRMLAEVDRLCTFLRGLRYTAADQLPRCSDPDDIKFLALVEASGANWLITKDKALLRRPRPRSVAGYRIGTPEQWTCLSRQTHCGVDN